MDDEDLARYTLRFLFITKHVGKDAIASSNRASIRGHIVKKGVSDFLGGVRWVNSNIICNIWCFCHGT